ncbi:MAG: glycosyltransferase [Betaproteobacteria bacterium]|nr:glycosyltransferase [Betaproteobacteria bacterium]
MTHKHLKVSFIIPVLHLKRPLNKARFFMPRYTLVDVLRDLHNNVTLTHEVIVVCNGQDKELIDLVTAHEHIHKYCLNSVNVGVARSWNMGAEMAEGEVLCFVNDDVEIGSGGVEKLYEVLMESQTVGQVGPVGARWNGAKHERFVGEKNIEEADAIAGFLFMLRENSFRNVGGFDPSYSPAGFEEIDMSFALRAQGLKCLAVPGLNLIHHHHHGVSSYNSTVSYLGKEIDTQALHLRNKAYFEKKWKIPSA